MGDNPKTYSYYSRVIPERITCGFLHIIVRNDMDSDDDCVEEYYRHWDGTGGYNAPDANARNAHPFNDTKIVNDPGRENLGHAIGDYDSFLFFVTVAGHLAPHTQAGSAMTGTHTGGNGATSLTDGESPTWITSSLQGQVLYNDSQTTSSTISENSSGIISTNDGISWNNGDSYTIRNTSGNTWYDDIPSHVACQHFVRYQLIGRHNNAYGHDTNNYLHYTQNDKWWIAEDGAVTNPVYQNTLIRNTGSIESGFGTDLSHTQSNNTYFSPVKNITVYGKHALGFDSTSTGEFVASTQHHAITSHPTTFYNLVVSINLHGFTQSEDQVAFFRDRINIFFQPFGETADFKFSTTEYTS